MPCFSLLASKVAPLGNGVHRENFDSILQLIRNGGSLPSCTSKVLIIGALLLERQYASKVTCSQSMGTPLSSVPEARVSDSRTLIRIAFFSDDAFANMATNRRPACRAAILRILINPTPPNTADASVAYPVSPNDSGSRSRRFGALCSLGVSRTMASPLEEVWEDRLTRGPSPESSPSPFVWQPVPSIRTGHFSHPTGNPGGPGFGPLGWRVGLERKDRPEFGAVILPFVGINSGNCV